MKAVELPALKDMPVEFEELVRLYPPRAIHDEVEYDNMQQVIAPLTSIPEMTPGQEEYLDTLAILFSAYERIHYPIDAD